MNKQRRKSLKKVISYLESVKAVIDSVQSNEQDSLSSLPYNFHDTERAYLMRDNVYDLYVSSLDIDVIISGIKEIIER